MVNLTGQLYAAAGLVASLLNVLGTPMLRSLGITSTLLICPFALCISALAFAAVPVRFYVARTNNPSLEHPLQ